MENHKFVFIGGLHRSGTSILYRTLRDHPQISGFSNTGSPEDEGQHLQSVYPPAKVYGGAGRFGLYPTARLDETSHLLTEENRRKLFNEWRSHWDLRKPVLMEKSPPNLLHTRFLQALFPHTYFIALFRHPIATTLATKRWRRRIPLFLLFEHWFTCYEQFHHDIPHLHHVLTLKYEDYVANPSTVSARICNFLDIEPVPVLGQDIRSSTNEKYFRHWQIIKRGLFTRYYARYLVYTFENRANRFGYSLKDEQQVVQALSTLYLA